MKESETKENSLKRKMPESASEESDPKQRRKLDQDTKVAGAAPAPSLDFKTTPFREGELTRLLELMQVKF